MLRLSLLLTVMLAMSICVGIAQAQPKGAPASGGIVCWKDKAGKVIGCGDKVPPEYQDNASEELNKRGITVKETKPALTPEQIKAQQAEADRKKAADAAKTEQQRRDKALLDTFSNEKEIDLKRNRDIQLLESNIETFQSNLKNANDRQAIARARIAEYEKNKQKVPQGVQDDYDKSMSDKAKIQQQIDEKRKQIAELNQRYDEMKKRFLELKGGAAANAPAAAPSKGPMTSADQRPR